MENENSKIKKLFPLELLQAPGNKGKGLSEDEILQKKTLIRELLLDYKITTNEIEIKKGPSVSLYRVSISSKTRRSAINKLLSDPPMGLESQNARIMTDIGHGVIEIELPNEFREQVLMSEALSSDEYLNSDFALPCVIGKSYDGYTVLDLTKMPHILIGGVTGQGKTTCINAIISSLLYSKLPSELKFVLIDPKKVEFEAYNLINNAYFHKIPGVESIIPSDSGEVVTALNALCDEMDARYELLKATGCRNISEYNEKIKMGQHASVEESSIMPYIAVIIDEFADIIFTSDREFEEPIGKLAALSRCVGIHLIISTQRPSFSVITGTIKSNFPARIAFRACSGIDSLTILDFHGAENLIGNGDMLFSSSGLDPIRVQGANIEEAEVKAVVEYLNDQGNLV